MRPNREVSIRGIRRAFLMYNDTFALRWMPGLVVSMDVEKVRSRARLLADQGGTGAWIQRVR